MEVRRVGVSDWEAVRELRLRALADAPGAFGSTYEREVAFADNVWMDRAGSLTNATFVAEVAGQRCGMVTVVRDDTDPALGWLVGMWVAPSVRGTGVADLLVTSALRWGADEQIETVRLHVADGNGRAERLYRRHGFSRTGATVTNDRPGLVEIEMRRRSVPQQQ
jgi:GNAT superfamily N-acetyltransferase